MRPRFGTLARWLRPAALAAGALALWPMLADAILVAPHALFMTDHARTGEVYLINQGTLPEEVTVGLEYGYPATDSLGNIYVKLIAHPGPNEPAATPWLRAFPRRARVEPGQRQLVRILATPPANLPDGEYWSRLLVTSHTVGQAVTIGNDSAVHAGLTLELRTITSVAYRKGAVHTGVTLSDFRASAARDSLIAWVGLAREGNAAYLGSVQFTVKDTTDRQVRQWSTPIAVYHPVERRFAVSLDSLPPGRYRLGLLVSTARDDIAQSNVLPADPIERTVGIEVR